MWYMKDEILKFNGLEGLNDQEKNLRTVLAARGCAQKCDIFRLAERQLLGRQAIADTARRMDFHGRWERSSPIRT